MSIDVSMPTTVSAPVAAPASSNRAIAALEKQIRALQKQITDAAKPSGPKLTEQQVQQIGQQISALQSQIGQLIQQDAQKAAQAQEAKSAMTRPDQPKVDPGQKLGEDEEQRKARAVENDSKLGTRIDTFT
jgi:hypothetical protein